MVPKKTFIDADLARQISRIAATQNRSDSAVIADVLRSRFAAESAEALKAGAGTTRRQLNRIEARLDKIIWEQTQAKACILLFIRVWLEHNPPLDPEIEGSAAASADARLTRFIELLVSELTTSNGGDELSERLGEALLNGPDEPEPAEASV